MKMMTAQDMVIPFAVVLILPLTLLLGQHIMKATTQFMEPHHTAPLPTATVEKFYMFAFLTQKLLHTTAPKTHNTLNTPRHALDQFS